ncbi:MAG: radical SAM protein, partial [Deltaproteobacteria bacterium]|nr:radical SAM protein [Deltaproteobacteria bacterium]
MFTLRKRALERRAREKVLYQRRPGGDIALCLVYPNVYRLGMGNLGFQAVYSIFEADARVAADRAFLPDADERPLVWSGRERLLSFERGMPLSEFEIIA